MIFLAYIGFDSITNSAEAINPQRTMPRGILGSLVALVLFVGVALVLVGMFHYSKYGNLNL